MTNHCTGKRAWLAQHVHRYNITAQPLAVYRPPTAKQYRRQASWQEDAPAQPANEWQLTWLGRMFVFLLCFIVAMLASGWLLPQLPGTAHVRTVIIAMLAGMLCEAIVERT